MMTQLRNQALERLIDELARVLWDPEQAKTLVLRAGFPPCDVPAFDVATAFWSRVIREAADGKLPGGVQPILDEVAARFPGNTFLAAYRTKGAVDVRIQEPRREHVRRPTAPSPPAVTRPMSGRMPSWPSLLQGVLVAGLAVSGVTLGPAWWKTNVDVPRPDIASAETPSMAAGTNVYMTNPMGAIEHVENVGTTNALVAADDPVETHSKEVPTKSEGKDDAAPDYVRADADADVGSPSKDCILDSSECNPSPKNSSQSSRSSRSKAIQTSSEELDIGLSEVGGAPIDLAMGTDCPLDPTKCDPPDEAGGTSAAHTSGGSTKSGAPQKRSYADISTAFAALKDTAKACGPQHGAEHDEKVYVELEFDGTSGTVLSATREPHADTPLGSCVAAVFEDIEVIKFKRYKHSVEYEIGM